MRHLIISFFAFSFFGIAAQAGVVDTCFKMKGSRKVSGYVRVTNESLVYVDWEFDSKAGSTKESGHATNYTKTNDGITFDSFLKGPADGSDIRITITPKNILFQGIDMDGNPGGELIKASVVNCPWQN